jgi:DNA-binding transcriptional regulator YhcF (GntR family)
MIDPSADRAQYRQIADSLRKAILSGALPDGARVPSEERLRQEHGVSRTTVRKAIEVLKGEGLVEVRAPRGTFVRNQQPMETVPLRRGDRVRTRMPSPDERREHDIREGVPFLIITRTDGTVEMHPGDRTQAQQGPSGR